MTGRRLRIAMLCLHSNPLGRLGTRDTGGMSVYVTELAAGLAERGHRVDVFTAAPSPGAGVLRPGVRIIQVTPWSGPPPSKDAFYPLLPAVWDAVEEHRRRERVRYDLVHSHYWLSAVVGAWAARAWDAPHVVTFHTLGAVKAALGGEEPGVRVRCEAEIARRCDRIVVPSLREARHLEAHCGVDRGRVAVIPCGVDLDRFRPGDRSAARRRLGLPPGAPVVLYVGRFAPLKGIDRLVRAAPLLPSGVRLVLVGGDGPGDPERARLQRLAGDLGVAGRVRFAGRVDHRALPPYYRAADVLVLPSLYESFGLVVLEALACGTPVVATPVGAVEQVVRPGLTGEIAADPSPGELARCIRRVLDRGRRAPGAVRDSVQGLSWRSVAAAVEGEYAALVGGGCRPGGPLLAAAGEGAP